MEEGGGSKKEEEEEEDEKEDEEKDARICSFLLILIVKIHRINCYMQM